jgi:hypothetical protein
MKYILIFLIQITVSNFAFSQIKSLKNDSPYPTKYLSSDDANLTLKTLTVASAYDNVGGIYKVAAESVLKELVTADQFWAYSEFQWPKGLSAKDLRIDAFDEKPQMVQQILTLTNSNAMLAVVTTKSPQGINVHLTLYTQDKGFPLIDLSYQDATTFELVKFKQILKDLYIQLKQKLPYKAFIASRRGNKVTINAGLNSNLKVGEKLSVAQIIKVNRHPKLKFMTGIEKEITGQIILNKVEEFSSFGEIVFEKEAGVIEKNSKLLPPDFIQYLKPEIANTSDQPIAESGASEWVPEAAPQFGKIVVMGGITDYKLSTVQTSGLAYDSGNSFSPTFQLGAELWMTRNYFASLKLDQMFFKGQNSLTGSFPQTLNYAVSNMDILFGYKYTLNGNFWGPSLTGGLGYLSKSTSVTDSSPTAFTSIESSGLQLQGGGYFPVTEKNDIGLGLDIKFLLTKRLSESPVDSGSATPSMSQFNIYGNYLYKSNINLKAEIIFSSLNAGFPGNGNRTNPAQSVEEKYTSYLFGLEYLF